MHKFLFCLATFLLTNATFLKALELNGELTQGSLIRGQLQPGSQLWLNEQEVKVADSGHFVFGFGRDAKLEHQLSWRVPQGNRQTETLEISARQYDVQKIEGIASKYVSPPKEVLERIRQDNIKVASARNLDDNRIDFSQDFIWPAAGPISGVYGSQRVFNGVPKRPHFGVDVAGPTGTPVYAPADGIVTLFESDMYYSGGTMLIDHGHGVSSTFLHLSKGHVEAGTVVKQGQLVAEIGATGRVTGAHLDWRINWFKERLDPALLVPKR
ncbi:MAG: murein DD-endopeptidase MepM/ murein hydrolase activator NlpD [Paraglaciecola sp.]|jgi:murein DD-endopeptidase MepM/ murein hydrolase activator NlpD